MKNILFYLTVICMMTGCARYSSFFKTAFYQASCNNSIFQEQALSFIRSLALHDAFATVALIDVLWISPAISTFLERDSYSNFVYFCVLLAPDEKNNILSFTDQRARWSVFLEDENGYVYHPLMVRRITIPNELMVLFGKKYSIFKGVYLIAFDTSVHEVMRLHFKSVQYSACLEWGREASLI